MTRVKRITPLFKLSLRLHTILKSSLCNYSDAYIPVKEIITVDEAGWTPTAVQVDGNNKQAIYKNCVPFTDCIAEINNTKVGNMKDLDVVMRIYNFIEYSYNYSKHLEFYINFVEMSQKILQLILIHLNLNQDSNIILIIMVL